MYARATLLEIDALRTSVREALGVFEQDVLPRLRDQPGYEGVLVCSTADGKGMLVTLWASAEAAEPEGEHGFYAQTLERHMTLFRAPPDRQSYEVLFAEAPALSGP